MRRKQNEPITFILQIPQEADSYGDVFHNSWHGIYECGVVTDPQ